MEPAEALALVEDLERFVLASVPGADPGSLERVRRACFRLRNQPAGAGLVAGSIQGWAEVYFSERKHRKYAGGADQVRQFILNDLMRLRMIVER